MQLSRQGKLQWIALQQNLNPNKEEILNIVGKNVAKWQIPDDVIFLDEIPHTATGKISKVDLRSKLKEMNYTHPDVRK